MSLAPAFEAKRATFRSPVYWTLLGLLIERPGYGYDLALRFEREFGDVLPLASVSHVYEGLKVLQEAELIEQFTSKRGAQPKPHYRARPEGIRAYAEWLKAQIDLKLRRSSLFARQVAALACQPELGLEVVEAFERSALRNASRTEIATGSESLAAALPAERARLAAEAELPWASFAKTRFAKLAEERAQ